jgi:hypothetical protein
MNQVTHSGATADYDTKNTALTYVDKSEQVGAATQSIQRTANQSNASKEGAATGHTNIFIPIYSAPLSDPNNGNNDVHNFKFDPNTQGTNDKIYRSLSDVPAGLRTSGGFNSNMRLTGSNVNTFATATLSAALASSNIADLNSPVSQTSIVADVRHSSVQTGPVTSGSQGASTFPPGTVVNGTPALGYGLAL